MHYSKGLSDFTELFSAWCSIKGQTYLNKPSDFSFA